MASTLFLDQFNKGQDLAVGQQKFQAQQRQNLFNNQQAVLQAEALEQERQAVQARAVQEQRNKKLTSINAQRKAMLELGFRDEAIDLAAQGYMEMTGQKIDPEKWKKADKDKTLDIMNIINGIIKVDKRDDLPDEDKKVAIGAALNKLETAGAIDEQPIQAGDMVSGDSQDLLQRGAPQQEQALGTPKERYRAINYKLVQLSRLNVKGRPEEAQVEQLKKNLEAERDLLGDQIKRDKKGETPTPATDIDDFVADSEIIRIGTSPDATPQQKQDAIAAQSRNDARLKIKRAQNVEVAANEKAKASVKLATVADIEQRKKTGGRIAEVNTDQYTSAIQATDSKAKIDKLITHLNTSDAITGLGATMLNQVERMKALIGSEVAAGRVTDTELLDIMMGSEVFPLIKSLGIGARGLDTPAEREFLRKVMTGEITLNKQTLLTMAEMRRDIQDRAISRWDERVESGELDNFFKSSNIKKRKLGGGAVTTPSGKTSSGNRFTVKESK